MTASPAPSGSPSAQSCPIGVVGSHVDVVDTPVGADLVFTASAERLVDLRARVRSAAQLYGIGAHKGLGHEGKHLGAQRHGLRLTELPLLHAEVEDIDGGARMRLVAEVASQVGDLQGRLRARVDEVNASPCD